MGAHPKKKISVARKRRRRSHLSASTPHLVVCPQCRSPKVAHQVCHICGTYDGRQVLNVNTGPALPGQ